MSQKQTINKIQETRRKYDHNSAIHVNCIRIGKGESLEHALTKFMLGWILINGGDVRIIYDDLLPKGIKSNLGPLDTKWYIKNFTTIIENRYKNWKSSLMNLL